MFIRSTLLAGFGLVMATPISGLCARNSSLSTICTTEYVQNSLPAVGFVKGVNLDQSSISVNAVYNYSVPATYTHPGAVGRSFCNVTFSYSHAGTNDKTNLWFFLPSPDQFQNRYLSTGGASISMTLGEWGLSVGLVYGAASGTTDGGFGGWDKDLSAAILRANGVLNYDAMAAYGYKAIHEMSVIGKELTRKFYNTGGSGLNSTNTKIYSYFNGCSEGGREGLSQIQRYGTQFDAAAIGAPAMREVVHWLQGPVVEKTVNYFPPPCELQRITADAVAACDSLDGKIDGVAARSDLCKHFYNATNSIGNTYNCSAVDRSFFQGGPLPAVSGTVSPAAAEVANQIWKGLFDSKGRRISVNNFPSVPLPNAETAYNPVTNSYVPFPNGALLNLLVREEYTFDFPLEDFTFDTMRDWIIQGKQKFGYPLEAAWPDLEKFRDNGGKVLHWHGEADGVIPAMSSTIYYDAVRKTMYPGLGLNESYAELKDWYKLFLVPGAGHCDPNVEQPTGAFPRDILKSLIDWAEGDVNPERLPATVLSGPEQGERQDICSWPLRPLWSSAGELKCVFDEDAMEVFVPSMDGIPVPVY
ncbi:putative tannase subunit protein [Podospora fimiseda]|uniref:Carboxylic ester hydrolase n=1 Tax=Podospora fimiseda TaxID=252190 RepID=A0AAN7BV96_9PEZI|nr:putative tannase subunit protein [Podospora fimiseda]